MMRFRAINESSSSGDESDDPDIVTREAQEEEAYAYYNSALQSQSKGNLEEAEETFRKILHLDFISEAQQQADSGVKCTKEEKLPLGPALNLKYLVLKNLGIILSKKEDYHSSVAFCLEALDIDSTDVTLWYHTGLTSLNLPNYFLSRLCFEEGLKCNSNHWPCMDHVITVTYALNDYANCLHHISHALEKEPSYLKGLVFRNQIFKEDPSLKTFCETYFEKCDPCINIATYDEDEAHKLIEEALHLRDKKRALCKPQTPPKLKFHDISIKEFTWKAVGEGLISMYEHITSSDVFISLNSKIDISEYLDIAKNNEVPASRVLVSSFETKNPVSSGKQSKPGLLCMVPSQAKDDESPNVSGINTPSSTCSETSSQNETHSSNPFVNTDAPPGRNKLLKRKRPPLPEASDLSLYGKRRSARVRNPVVKRPQDVNYQEILLQFIPQSLMGEINCYDQDDNDSSLSRRHFGGHAYGETTATATEQATDVNSLSSTEKQDVEDFIAQYQSNGGLIDLLYKFVVKLGAKSNYLWPKELPDVFTSAFIKMRKHIIMPNLFCNETEEEFTREIGFAVLAFFELKIDQHYLSSSHSTSSSLSSAENPSTFFQTGPDYALENFHSDMEFLMQLTVRQNVLRSHWLDFTVRALWLKAKFHSIEGEMDMAASCMEKLSDVLQTKCEPTFKVIVVNSSFANVITSATVHQQLELLQQCQSVEEIQRLYENGFYQSVVDRLVSTFGHAYSKPKTSSDGSIPARHVQLMLLQDSLWKLKNYQECVKWTEVAFKETVQQFMNASNTSAKSDWTDTMAHLLSGLERCIEVDKNILNTLELSKLMRLSQNLILLISLQMDSYDIPIDSPVTVLSWIVLYRLIHNEELKEKKAASEKTLQKSQGVGDKTSYPFSGKSIKIKSELGTGNIDDDSSMPSSLSLLITAHECLGRRSCCCASDGLFLLHCVDVMVEKLQDTSSGINSYHVDLENALEQAFYCLYGHPHKRTKAKHLQEHNSHQIPLTWERASNIYHSFKPQEIPEFDSYRTSAVSAELENLLKRIAALVPPELDPSSRVDAYIEYIEGGTDVCPTFPTDISHSNAIVQDLYYLLADYYFKNKEFSKANQYYLMDVCINPDRLDSWAGMALSRSSQLDRKLDSYEVKNIIYDSKIWHKTSAALRCFEHALQIDKSRNSLWIEYGSLAYVLHSHASRQLKLDIYFDGPRDLLKVKKEEMLLLSERCFMEANKSSNNAVPEEAWLHHYMLGKIAQKMGKSPTVFLDHYKKSLHYLHEDRARYPHRIQYHNPPELSVEVLEVFYRIHATCLKYLSKCESTGMPLKELKIYQDCLSEVSAGPFSVFQEKIKVESGISSPSVYDQDKFLNHNSSSAQIRTSADHNYCNTQHNTEKTPDEVLCNCDVAKLNSCTLDVDLDVISEVVEYLKNSVSSLQTFSGNDNDIPKDNLELPKAPTTAVNCNELKQNTNNLITIQQIPTNSGALLESYVSSPTKISMKSNYDCNYLMSAAAVCDDITEDITANINNLSDNKPYSLSKHTDTLMDDVVITLNDIIAKVLSPPPLASCESTFCIENDENNKNRRLAEDFARARKLNQQKPDCSDIPFSASCCSLTHRENESIQTSQTESGMAELEENKFQIHQLILNCLCGLRECVKRFSQHYKSLYHIANYYCRSTVNKNLQRAREVLLAATPAVKGYPSMPGLFAERKNTNFFNGIWHSPSHEIDRPGSFGAHMYRSVHLLINVLTQQSDYNMLLYVTQQLYRNPDLGKKYMRDVERISLARQAYNSCVTILREQMNSLLQEEPPPEESRLTCCLLEIYRTFQTLIKGGIYVEDTNELLEEAYTMYKLGEVDQFPPVLDQAIVFCQLQLGKSYQVVGQSCTKASICDN